MTDTIKQHPLGVCKLCGAITYRKESVNQPCGRSLRGHRCSGTFAIASRDAGWKQCTSCSGTGKQDAASCIYCQGIGWNLAKPWSL
jgi:hypothetical protein